MTATHHDPALDARYWPVPVLRAVPLLVLGLVTTFVNDHSASVGLTVFGSTTIAGGILLAVASWRYLADASSRTLAVVQGVVGVVFGLVALLAPSGGLPTLVAVVTGWAIITGALELFTGLRRRRQSQLARDWMLLGGLTLALALVYLVVPTDYSKQLGGIEEIRGTLTSSTILVGVVGAYGALVGVFLIIQGLSLKWQTGQPETYRAPGSGAAEPRVSGETHDSSTDGAHSS
ncbi:DUF308 domain-containing protein [Frondihabitans sp. VKM Ac-2883]|uniref:DUF308 domain-containing protein n=1 Tax=Frondihabitans sp. VKM Ac-2883 TaxID=2783823 RepID=UPI00188C65C4|nr:DUF308 domain-containing protein [Frondihabitans sp. VKM Ac-2883]